MASREAGLVVSMMKSAHVTANEAMAFMGQALTIMERTKPGQAVDFIKELIERRESRTMPDLSSKIR
ncbi:hypothetical protein SEA_PLATTE_92 [Microbacterium phage Platte]|nr:hypothetical protein SEA_HORTUS1_93 [Microbacterium phage Hortus1]AWY05663.1 hypothetical protein SEA_OLINDD_93 [Microbacterium phage OlinDD]AWY05916.1 hypothetical protein SEA_PIONEER3_93 [Microbacterium phage Pioneer3]AWY06422.1 hypothetical protein SEA_TANDEM_93 [Microbacterium phage Tandem]QAU07423.1 hypothetical protein SEA_ALLEB_91 [Microbacterium phage Alleb]QZD97684.1 hypothetical protein SEA_PLATTE_92 [Microbacterium phage Platte]